MVIFGHCRPWEKIILSRFSAPRAGGWSGSPDSDFRAEQGKVSRWVPAAMVAVLLPALCHLSPQNGSQLENL